MLTAAGTKGLAPAEILARLVERGYLVTKRTIHRDIEGLQAAGFPVAESGSKSGMGGVRWKVDVPTTANGAIVKINKQQLAGLYLAKTQLRSMASNPLFAGLDHFFEQISDLIGSRNRALLDEFAKTIHMSLVQRSFVDTDPQVLECIQSAIQEGQCLSLKYQSASSGTDRIRTLGAHYIYIGDQGVYLVAEDLESQLVKTFALPRMRDACMTDQPYTGRATTPHEIFGASFGVWHADHAVTARINISSALALYIKERQWHPSQKITERSDGSITLELKVGITPHFVGWILGFGHDAEVESPEALREAVSAEAHCVSSKYLRRVS